MSLENFNRMTFDLLEATVSLYLQNSAGGAGALVAQDLRAENLRGTEKWIVVQTRPSGALYPVNHPLVPEYTVNIGRLLAYDFSNPTGIQTAQPGLGNAQTYVLDIVWNDETGIGWHRETFYGVTIASRNGDARDVESGVMDNLEFQAQYMIPAAWSVSVPTPPAPATLPPLYVRYLDATGTNVIVYTFAAPAGPAAWTYVPTLGAINPNLIVQDSFGNFAVTFSGHAAPALSLASSDGILRMSLLVVGDTPTAADLPRLDFYAGNTRLGSVTEKGILYCSLLTQVNAPEQNGFLFGPNLGLAMTPAASWSADGLQVLGVEEFFPTDPQAGGGNYSALLAWHRMESLAEIATGQTVCFWPDETVNGNALAASGAGLGPTMDFTEGVRAVVCSSGDYFHCANLFNTRAFQVFVVAERAMGYPGVPVAGFGASGGGAASGSVRWYGGSQSALLQPGAIQVMGTLPDGNEWCVYELQKGATGSSLRLNGQLDGFTAHGAFGAVQDYFFCGTGDSVTGGPTFNGWVRQGLVYGRELTATEADQVRMWLRANLNLA